MTRSATSDARGSLDPAEVEKFQRMAESWWDPEGDSAPLHKLNPTRLGFIREHLIGHFGLEPRARRPLDGLRVLDLGCGGGLISEPLARLGAEVTGIDAADEAIAVARAHAEEQGLEIDYRAGLAEDLAADGVRFDAVVCMEVVEHVADVGAFLNTASALVKPGGALFLATLNRTPKSFMTAIVGAEYVLRWLPRGTHDWRRFLRPSELAAYLDEAGLDTIAFSGMVYNPLSERWRLDPGDLDVNYLCYAEKPES